MSLCRFVLTIVSVLCQLGIIRVALGGTFFHSWQCLAIIFLVNILLPVERQLGKILDEEQR